MISIDEQTEHCVSVYKSCEKRLAGLIGGIENVKSFKPNIETTFMQSALFHEMQKYKAIAESLRALEDIIDVAFNDEMEGSTFNSVKIKTIRCRVLQLTPSPPVESKD